MPKSFKKELISGTFWSLIGQFGYLGVTLVANIVLARILSPGEFGQLGIILFFIVISKVLTESGLGGALIRNKNATDIDFSTVFVFNLIVSIILFFVLIIFSGFIAKFYDDPEIKILLRVSSFILIINAFQLVQGVKLVKSMRFKQKAFYEFIAVLVSASVGIFLAFKGFGVWSLVSMQILTALIITILFWVFEGRNGPFLFSVSSFKSHYKFGMNTTFASLINSFFDNIYQAILGKYFSLGQTGLYYQAKKLQEIPVSVINRLIQNVFFSGLAKIQDDHAKFKITFERVTRLFTILVGAICLTLFVFSKELIILILGKQWGDASFFLKILSLVGFFYIQEMFNRILFKIFDDTKYILNLELVKKIIQSLSILIGLMYNSIEVLMFGFLITSILSYLINFYFTKQKYSFLSNIELFTVLKVFLIFILAITANYFIDFGDYEFQFLFKLISTAFIFIGGLVVFNLIDYKNDFDIISKR